MNIGMHRKRKMASTIISGTDGPASVFIAGKDRDRNIIRRIRTHIRRKRYQRKRARLAADLVPNAHTLPELCAYIREKYRAEEIDASDFRYREQYKSIKASMIQKYQPELLGESLEAYRPEDFTDTEAVKKFLEQCEAQVERAADIPAEQFPFEYHQYIIRIEGCGTLNIAMDMTHEYLSYGYSAEKGKRKHMDRIVKDIYLYYGITREDKEQNSERMQSLLTILASMS